MCHLEGKPQGDGQLKLLNPVAVEANGLRPVVSREARLQEQLPKEILRILQRAPYLR